MSSGSRGHLGNARHDARVSLSTPLADAHVCPVVVAPRLVLGLARLLPVAVLSFALSPFGDRWFSRVSGAYLMAFDAHECTVYSAPGRSGADRTLWFGGRDEVVLRTTGRWWAHVQAGPVAFFMCRTRAEDLVVAGCRA